jgi:hypothetical protein
LAGSPRQRFTADLVAQLLQWKNNGDEIILFMDLNEHAYSGDLALRLLQDDLLMTECFKSANGRESPASHYIGGRSQSLDATARRVSTVSTFMSHLIKLAQGIIATGFLTSVQNLFLGWDILIWFGQKVAASSVSWSAHVLPITKNSTSCLAATECGLRWSFSLPMLIT